MDQIPKFTTKRTSRFVLMFRSEPSDFIPFICARSTVTRAQVKPLKLLGFILRQSPRLVDDFLSGTLWFYLR